MLSIHDGEWMQDIMSFDSSDIHDSYTEIGQYHYIICPDIPKVMRKKGNAITAAFPKVLINLNQHRCTFIHMVVMKKKELIMKIMKMKLNMMKHVKI